MYVCGVRKSALPENYPAGKMPIIRKFKGLMTFVDVVSVHVYSAAIICSYKYRRVRVCGSVGGVVNFLQVFVFLISPNWAFMESL